MALFETEEKPTVADLLAYAKQQQFHFKQITPDVPLTHPFLMNEINRPGLSLVGYFEYFGHSRVQIFGRGEFACLEHLQGKKDFSSVEKLFSYDIPAVIFSHGNMPSQKFIEIAQAQKIPIFISKLFTADLIEKIYDFFEKSFSYKETINGVMMEIFGLGVLISGDKGIGKSECALELIERGHRFIADEIVEVSRRRDKTLTAKSSSLISKHMNLRGIGIVNVAHLFGVRSILKQTRMDLCINLQHELEVMAQLGKQKSSKKKTNKVEMNSSEKENFAKNEMSQVASKGNSLQCRTILGCNVALVSLPVGIASNTPILIETAVMNYSLKLTGYNTAVEFSKKILKATLAAGKEGASF